MLSRIILTPLIVLAIATTPLFTQSLSLQSDPEVRIEGTSNVHDWEADVTKVEARFEMNGMDQMEFESLSAENFSILEFTMPVKDIDTNKRGLTSNIHKYLKEKDHPNITFKLSEITNVEWKDGYAEITANGVINAAGNNHTVTMTVKAEQQNGAIVFSGTQDLKMTDFGIDPPTALFGTVRAKDEITIHYNVSFKS